MTDSYICSQTLASLDTYMALDLMRVVQGLTDDAVQLGFIGIVITQYKVGEHGAGTHQWNLPYSAVVYARQVNLLLGYHPSLPR